MGVVASAAINSASNMAVGGMQLAAQKEANKTNKEIAESVNKTNKENVAATNQANLDIAQMNNEYNQKQLETQLKNQWDMWNAENAYNDPSKQMERFQNAGLNPYMAAGNVSSGNASSMTAPTPQPASPAQMQAAQAEMYQQQPLDFSGFRNLVSDYLASVEAENRIESQRLENEGKKIDNEYRAKMFEANLSKILADTDLSKSNKAYQDSAKKGLDTSNFFQPYMLSSELKQRETDRMFTNLRAQGQMLANLSSYEWYKVLPKQIQQEITSKAMAIKQQALTHELTQAEINKKINEAVTEFYKGANEQNKFDLDSSTLKFQRSRIIADLIHAIQNSGPDNIFHHMDRAGYSFSNYVEKTFGF